MLGSARHDYGKVLLDVVEGCSAVTVFPQTQRVRLVRLSLFGGPATSISSPGKTKDKPWKHRLRERTNRRLRRQPSKKHSKPMFRARHEFVTCSRSHQGMDTDGLERVTDGLENWVFSKKVTKEANHQGVCPREESTDEPTQSGISSTDQGRRRWGIQQPPRQGVNVKSTWPGCEVKLGTCHCLQYHSHMFHTRIPGWSSPTTEGILCGGDPSPWSVRRNHFSRLMGTAMERKPTPALQALAP